MEWRKKTHKDTTQEANIEKKVVDSGLEAGEAIL
jgi:hypothetical protein